MATKQEQAIELLKQNPDISTSELAKLIQEKIGMTPLGARTYAYNARKALGVAAAPKQPKAEKAPKTEKQPKAPKAEKQPKAPKAEKQPKAKVAKVTKQNATEEPEHVDPSEMGARELHKKSYISFIPWTQLDSQTKREFMSEAKAAA